MWDVAQNRSVELPEVTVIVLNWNGLRYLGRCMTALMQTTYPSDRFKVILADNASTDGSPAWVRKRFPDIQVLETGGNLGFGAGNNRAIRAIGSPFVALLNTDTAVQADWLLHLVRPMADDQRIGATTAKLLYMNDYLPLLLQSESFVPDEEMKSGDTRRLGVQVYGAEVVGGGKEQSGEVRLLAGFYAAEHDAEGQLQRWTDAKADLGLPVGQSGAQDRVLELMLAAWRPDSRPVHVSLTCAGNTLYKGAVDANPRRVRVAVPASLFQHAKSLIQNAGSSVLPDGSGRDRGTRLSQGHVYPIWDDGRFDTAEEVFHFNGAACLLRREMLDDVGLFDERFFMYYEDMDLAWRARARGWKVWYVPQAIVRHVHSGSAGEWSPLFTYNVDLNRLLMLMKNAPWQLAQQQLRRYAAETAWNLAQSCGGLLLRRTATGAHLRRLWIRLKVWVRLLLLTPSILRSRRVIDTGRTVSQADLGRWLQSSDDQVGHTTRA